MGRVSDGIDVLQFRSSGLWLDSCLSCLGGRSTRDDDGGEDGKFDLKKHGGCCSNGRRGSSS